MTLERIYGALLRKYRALLCMAPDLGAAWMQGENSNTRIYGSFADICGCIAEM